LRNRGDRSLHIAVHITNVVDCRVVVDDRRVVDVRDRGLIDSRVGDVDAIYIRRAHAVCGNVNLSRTEREPGYGRSNRGSASHERDQSRRVHGPFFAGTGDPAPSSIKVGPAPIVKWSIPPAIIIDPRPSPRINPRPVAFVIWSPAAIYAWKPDVPILRIRSPISIVVEIFKSHDAARTIPRRRRIVITTLTAVTPVIEIVRIADLVNFCI
jgi:hypothetical protein